MASRDINNFVSTDQHAMMKLMHAMQHGISPIQQLKDSLTQDADVSLSIKREDQLHIEVMGNKLRKLKYNLLHARQRNAAGLLSFGGAWSNHILALSAAGNIFNMPTIGVIRGEELALAPLNPVLSRAQQNGMEFKFVSRADYKRKSEADFIQELYRAYGQVCIIPEGGTNAFAVDGVTELVQHIPKDYDVIVCACGTGGTLAGLIKGMSVYGRHHVRVIGVAVLKGGEFIADTVKTLLCADICRQVSWEINTGFHFGGYARRPDILLEFMRWFRTEHAIDLDTVYTGKMMYAVYDMIKSGQIKAGSKVLALHTGGTQTASLDHIA